ncbi:MAG: hypothetical protein HRT61_15780 [Ekhidna sp.]|nr:hypothetical protein [Ekhidna sp.]
MKKILYYEWLHFWRNPARPIATLLFVSAAVFGILNGVSTYMDRQTQLVTINERIADTQAEAYEWFDSGKSGPEGRPWVDINSAFWSMWYASHHLMDVPDPTMSYNVGQSAHFGYYKRVSMWSTAFDSDLTAEIANPEITQSGALDFSFVWIYLMPLLLIVLTFHIKGMEEDMGFLNLLKVQKATISSWILQRLFVIGFGLLGLLLLSVFIPVAFIADIALGQDILLLFAAYTCYLLMWMLIVFLIILFGQGQANQALKMVGVWLLLAVVIPGVVNQYVLLNKPADLMMDMIEAGREGQSEIFAREKDEILKEVMVAIPDLKSFEVAKNDTLITQEMINGAYRVVLNEYMGQIVNAIIEEQNERNGIIASTYFFNPVTAFHFWLNSITKTGHQDNLRFRKKIQEAGDKIHYRLTLDEWQNRRMDRQGFDAYVNLLSD